MYSLRRNSVKLALLGFSGLFLIPLFKILLTSAVFSYAVYPSKKLFKKFLRNNALASMVCTLFWVFVAFNIIMLLLVMTVFAVNEAQAILVSQAFLDFRAGIEEFLTSSSFGEVILNIFSLEALVNFIASLVSSIAVFAPSIIINTGLIILFSYYFLKDGDKMIDFFTSLLSGESKRFLNVLLKKLNKVFMNIIYGYILTAIVIGALVYASFSLLGIPNSFLLGLMATILSIIPLAGPLVPSLIALVHLTIQGSFAKIVVLIIINLVLSFVDNIVRAFVNDKASKDYKVHPLLFIAGIVSGSVFFGPIGLIAGPMFFGGMSVLIKEFG